MAKRVFFSFHYQDVIDFRANVVRNSWLTKSDREAAGFFDHSLWETAKKFGDANLKNMINEGMDGSSVSVVLIGTETYRRPWVRYEILKSLERRNKVIGIHINSIKGRDGLTKVQGPNPFEYLGIQYNADGSRIDGREWDGNGWIGYGRIDSSLGSNSNQTYWNKFHQLSHFYHTYDWIADDGYNNLGSWVK